MNRPLQAAGVLTAVITAAGLVTGLSGVDLASAQSATATTAVNIRSGPGTNYRIVGGLYRGQSITRLAAAHNGWVKVRFNGATAYVASSYLSLDKSKLPPAPTTIYTNGTKIATALLNVRSTPSLSASVVGYVSEGQHVTLTGKLSHGYAEVLYGGARKWVTARYLVSATDGLPKVTGTRVATADLIIRSSSTNDYVDLGEVKKGTRLSVTGAVQNGRAQIVYSRSIRWVTARYLTNSAVLRPGAPSLPRVVGTRYATTTLNVRSSAANRYTLITEVNRGTKLSITGVQSNGRAQIVYGGAVRWVTAQYLSTRKPGTSSGSSTSSADTSSAGTSSVSYGVERGLKPNAIKVHRAALAAFPQIKTYYGVRPGFDPGPPVRSRVGSDAALLQLHLGLGPRLRSPGRELGPRQRPQPGHPVRDLQPAHLEHPARLRGLALHGRPGQRLGQPQEPRPHHRLLSARGPGGGRHPV